MKFAICVLLVMSIVALALHNVQVGDALGIAALLDSLM